MPRIILKVKDQFNSPTATSTAIQNTDSRIPHSYTRVVLGDELLDVTALCQKKPLIIHKDGDRVGEHDRESHHENDQMELDSGAESSILAKSDNEEEDTEQFEAGSESLEAGSVTQVGPARYSRRSPVLTPKQKMVILRLPTCKLRGISPCNTSITTARLRSQSVVVSSPSSVSLNNNSPHGNAWFSSTPTPSSGSRTRLTRSCSINKLIQLPELTLPPIRRPVNAPNSSKRSPPNMPAFSACSYPHHLEEFLVRRFGGSHSEQGQEVFSVFREIVALIPPQTVPQQSSDDSSQRGGEMNIVLRKTRRLNYAKLHMGIEEPGKAVGGAEGGSDGVEAAVPDDTVFLLGSRTRSRSKPGGGNILSRNDEGRGVPVVGTEGDGNQRAENVRERVAEVDSSPLKQRARTRRQMLRQRLREFEEL